MIIHISFYGAKKFRHFYNNFLIPFSRKAELLLFFRPFSIGFSFVPIFRKYRVSVILDVRGNLIIWIYIIRA